MIMGYTSKFPIFARIAMLTTVICSLGANGIKVSLTVLHAGQEDHIHLQCAMVHLNTTIVSISWSKDGHIVGYFNVSQSASSTTYHKFLGRNATVAFNKTKQFQDVQIYTPQKADEGLYLCQIKGKTAVGKFGNGSAETWVKLTEMKSDFGLNILFFIITVVAMIIGMYVFLHCYLKFCNVSSSRPPPSHIAKHRRHTKKLHYVPSIASSDHDSEQYFPSRKSSKASKSVTFGPSTKPESKTRHHSSVSANTGDNESCDMKVESDDDSKLKSGDR